jgi:hypothetical protein
VKYLFLRHHAVLQHIHIIEQIELLEAHTDLRTVLIDILCVENILSCNIDKAAVRLFQKIDTAQQGGFA